MRFFGNPAPIQKNYLAEDLRSDAAGYTLAGSVHIQVGVAAGEEMRETAFVDSQAQATGLPSAIVAFCDLSSPDADTSLDAQQRFDRTRGIRQIVGRSAEEDRKTGSDRLIDDPTWQENLMSLAGRGLSFDLQLIPPQMQRVARLLSTMPELKVALCHCGSPWDQTPAGLESWRAGIRALAELPNVYCKISGLAMFDHDWTEERIRPLIEFCIGEFGAERCMFGSNFPVDKLHKSYEEIWRAYEAISRELSAEARARLFGGTASAFYRL